MISKVSFRSKNETICPICEKPFHREELLSGGGRMNAGTLTDELHREYLPTKKYGVVTPLIYPVSVCPYCLYAAYPKNFGDVTKEIIERLRKIKSTRREILEPVFPNVNFEKNRGIPEGIASYILAGMTYDYLSKDLAPTFIRGVSFLRAGWLARELHKTSSGENYDYLANLMLRKAAFFYGEILECERTRSESIEEVLNLGPDIDNNYGYDGVMYLIGLLTLKYGQRENNERRIEALGSARNAVSRVVGMGKSSREKPSALLDWGRVLHKNIKAELEKLTGEET